MRYSIYEGEKENVQIQEEIEFLENYIELHKMRYHKLIDVDFNVPNRIFVQSNKKHIQLETENILYIVATGNYTKIITLTGPISIREKFSAFLEQLPKNDFVQVHKSFAVAPKQINSVEGNMIFISIIRFQLEKFIK